jgi:UDP-glucose 4-epimerase
MNVLVLGGAGELGSNFSKLCIEMGHKVTIVDLTRFLEAWRLNELGIHDKVVYRWGSTFDLTPNDLEETDIILDCACQADRPLGTNAPKHTLMLNLLGPLSILEVVKNAEVQPFLIYPSSSVEFLGVPKAEQPLTEFTRPKPTNLYGFTKWAAEELYLTYNRAHKIPCMIIRTGSCYGPMMRTDQFIAQCIIKCLRGGEGVLVKSPDATRTYTYTGDVLEFYRLLLIKFEEDPCQFNGEVLSNGGNAENKPYTTFAVAEMIRKLTGGRNLLKRGDYEIGEMINGEPVFQWETSTLASKRLGWKPQHTLEEGLKETVEWFREFWFKDRY